QLDGGTHPGRQLVGAVQQQAGNLTADRATPQQRDPNRTFATLAHDTSSTLRDTRTRSVSQSRASNHPRFTTPPSGTCPRSSLAATTVCDFRYGPRPQRVSAACCSCSPSNSSTPLSPPRRAGPPEPGCPATNNRGRRCHRTHSAFPPPGTTPPSPHPVGRR